MTQEPKSNPQTLPLTVAHGKKLHDQSIEISQQLLKLMPLLALLEAPDPTDSDPISLILQYLETLAQQEELQTNALNRIEAKLDAILDSNIIARSADYGN